MSELLLKGVNEYSTSTLVISSVFELRERLGCAHVYESIYELWIQNFNLL